MSFGNSKTSGQICLHIPWLLGVLISPFFFGSLTHDGQALVAILFGLSVIFLFKRIGGYTSLDIKPVMILSVLLFFCLVLIPIPSSLIKLVSPERALLAERFPVNIGETQNLLQLTTSVARTFQRYWELLLVVVAFFLAKELGFLKRKNRLFVYVVGVTSLCLSIWYFTHLPEGSPVVGTPSHRSLFRGSGPFTNPNHYANWQYMAVLFCGGWIMRGLWPLRSARSGDAVFLERHKAQAWALVIICSIALFTAVGSASRGGLFSFLIGALVWSFFLAYRSHSRTRALLINFGIVMGLAIILFGGDLLFRRFGELPEDLLHRYPKVLIWKETILTGLKFPVFGTGLGTFVRVYNHYKSNLGLNTVWHAENEYVQLLLEVGVVCLVLIGVIWLRIINDPIKKALNEKVTEPELLFGSLAAVACFIVHSCFEFVFQIPSNAIFVGALLGFCVGLSKNNKLPILLPDPSHLRQVVNLSIGVALIVFGISQGISWFYWQNALRKASPAEAVFAIDRSLQYWPIAVERNINLIRAQVQALAVEEGVRTLNDGNSAMVRSIRSRITEAIRRDPLNWELRLERAWFDLAFSTNQAMAIAEAWECVRLNPHQPQIPIRFAKNFVGKNNYLAINFLKSADLSYPHWLNTALSIAWDISRDTSLLWELTPATKDGFETLGNFAYTKRLNGLATEAWLSLTNLVEPSYLAEKFLMIKRPDIAIGLLSRAKPSPKNKLIFARANFMLGKIPEAIRLTEEIWQSSPLKDRLLKRSESEKLNIKLKTILDAEPKTKDEALAIAESIFARPASERDLKRLRSLAMKFPDALRIWWILYKSELDNSEFENAAATGIILAQKCIDLLPKN